MTAIDQHILQLIETLSEDGKEVARKMLGKSKKVKKTNNQIRKKLINNLFKNNE